MRMRVWITIHYSACIVADCTREVGSEPLQLSADLYKQPGSARIEGCVNACINCTDDILYMANPFTVSLRILFETNLLMYI